MSFSTLKNKVVLVTGGSSGIGKALVELLVHADALVATCGRDAQQLQKSLAHLPMDKLLMVQADVTKVEECDHFIKTVVEKWDRIDVLINNAGRSMRALFADVDTQVLQQLMNVNFWGTVYCTQAALPFLQKSKGTIVGISSIAGYRGLPGRTGYSASKFALQGFLEALRTELLYSGVHVMWVSPGFTQSNIRHAALNQSGQAQKETPLKEEKLMSAAEVAHRIVQAIIKKKRTVVMTRQGHLAVWINKWWPSFADRQVYKLFAAESDSLLHRKK